MTRSLRLQATAGFETVAGAAAAAEADGFHTVWAPDGPLEPYTLLCALALRTSAIRLGVLWTDVGARNPAIVAKQVTTLDIVSGGRAVLGVGAERSDVLEEALQVCNAMFVDERPSMTGRYHRIEGAANLPRPRQAGGPPIAVVCGPDEPAFEVATRLADEIVLRTGRRPSAPAARTNPDGASRLRTWWLDPTSMIVEAID